MKDTNVFVNGRNNFKVPEKSFLVAMGVRVLYTNIPYFCCHTKTQQNTVYSKILQNLQ